MLSLFPYFVFLFGNIVLSIVYVIVHLLFYHIISIAVYCCISRFILQNIVNIYCLCYCFLVLFTFSCIIFYRIVYNYSYLIVYVIFHDVVKSYGLHCYLRQFIFFFCGGDAPCAAARLPARGRVRRWATRAYSLGTLVCKQHCNEEA